MAGLSADEVSLYWKQGFLHVPGLLDKEEVRALSAELTGVVAREDASAAAGESFPRASTEGRPLRNLIDPIRPYSLLVSELLASDRVAAPLRSLLGGEPSLFKDKLILRPPGTQGYGLHQDFQYYGWTGVAADQLLAVQIAIDDADAENGALEICAGQQRRLLPRNSKHSGDLSPGGLDAVPQLIPTRAGDALFFHSLTPHQSGTNRSQRYRRTLYLTYNKASAGELYRIYYQDRAAALAPCTSDAG